MSDLLRFLFETQDSFKDANRVRSLYDDFTRLAQIDPAGYRANIHAWRQALIAAAQAGVLRGSPGATGTEASRFVVETGDALLRDLDTRQFGRPQGLARVLEDAVHRRDLIPLTEFETSESSIYVRRWLPAIPSLGDILMWSWSQLGFGQGRDHSLPQAKWIVPEVLESASTDLLEHLDSLRTSLTTSIHTLESLRPTLPPSLSLLSNADLILLFRYMSRDKPSLTTNAATASPDAIIIKHTTPPSPLTATDATVAELKTLQSRFDAALAAYDASSAALTARARACLPAHPERARALLARRRLADGAAARLRAHAERVEGTLRAIDAAGDNAAVVRALAAGARALERLNGEVGGVEGAEKVLDEVAERNAEVEEISAVVGEGAPVVDEEEVEGELEALEREVKEKAGREREETQKADEMKALDEVHALFREREREAERKKAEKAAREVDSSAELLKELQIA